MCMCSHLLLSLWINTFLMVDIRGEGGRNHPDRHIFTLVIASFSSPGPSIHASKFGAAPFSGVGSPARERGDFSCHPSSVWLGGLGRVTTTRKSGIFNIRVEEDG